MAKGTKIGRNAKSGKFVLGRAAFASISAVEGIKLSKRMAGDLRQLEKASPKVRRARLAATYGNDK